jgi:hypothetical protein
MSFKRVVFNIQKGLYPLQFRLGKPMDWMVSNRKLEKALSLILSNLVVSIIFQKHRKHIQG